MSTSRLRRAQRGVGRELPTSAIVKDGIVHVHDFTYVAQYENATGLVAIVSPLYGPRAADYVTRRGGSTLASRGRIWYFQVERKGTTRSWRATIRQAAPYRPLVGGGRSADASARGVT